MSLCRIHVSDDFVRVRTGKGWGVEEGGKHFSSRPCHTGGIADELNVNVRKSSQKKQKQAVEQERGKERGVGKDLLTRYQFSPTHGGHQLRQSRKTRICARVGYPFLEDEIVRREGEETLNTDMFPIALAEKCIHQYPQHLSL